jgi:hypothetical protein
VLHYVETTSMIGKFDGEHRDDLQCTENMGKRGGSRDAIIYRRMPNLRVPLAYSWFIWGPFDQLMTFLYHKKVWYSLDQLVKNFCFAKIRNWGVVIEHYSWGLWHTLSFHFSICYWKDKVASRLYLECESHFQSIRERRFRPRNDIDTKIQDLDESFGDDDPAYNPLQWDLLFNSIVVPQGRYAYTELTKIGLIVGTLSSNHTSHLAVWYVILWSRWKGPTRLITMLSSPAYRGVLSLR